MITIVNLNRDNHIETLDITNMHGFRKNKLGGGGGGVWGGGGVKQNTHLFLVVVVSTVLFST